LQGDSAFFAAVLKQARSRDLLSDEHFTVDGTLLEAWAGQKSFRRVDDDQQPPIAAFLPVEVHRHAAALHYMFYNFCRVHQTLQRDACDGGRNPRSRLEFGRVDGIIESKAGSRLGGCAMKPDVWEIVRNKDGTFDMFHKSKLMHSSIPDKWLKDQVGRYGFCGREYHDIRRQLDQGGKAKIVL
jgi:hypothetical protein